MVQVAVGVAVAVVVAAILILLLVRSMLIICEPDQVAVISGRKRVMSDGREVGYRVLRGGRTLRVPLLEKVAWLQLNAIPIEVAVGNAYSKGAIPLHVQGIANLKISSKEGILENAIERFLDVPLDRVAQIAKETLEANLRGVLATLTPEEVNEDRLKFAQTLIEEADDDIKILGLDLDTLKIQNVTDEVGYLTSVGRRKTADVLKEARVVEALRKAEAEQTEADAQQRADVSRSAAALLVAEKQNELRVRQAELEALAAAKEAEAKAAGEKAAMRASQEVEAERIEFQRRRLEVEVVEPANAQRRVQEVQAEAAAKTREIAAAAEARTVEIDAQGKAKALEIDAGARALALEVESAARSKATQVEAVGKSKALELEAKGLAAKIAEDGAAQVAVFRQFIDQFAEGGPNAHKIMVLQMMPELLAKMVEMVESIKIDKVSIIDSGNGSGGGAGVAGFVSQLPGAAIRLLEQMETATGVDLLAALRSEGNGVTGAPVPPASVESVEVLSPEGEHAV